MREAELKHGRVGMLASLGFFTTEAFGYHPLLNNNSAGCDALADPALGKFWPFGAELTDSISNFALIFEQTSEIFAKL